MEAIEGLFWSNVTCHLVLLAGAVWCVAFPNRRIYPMTAKGGVITSGPYAFTRSPQYFGNILLFTGVSIVAKSELVLVTHVLTSLFFMVAPRAEEPWLDGQNGDPYRAYRSRIPRWL